LEAAKVNVSKEKPNVKTFDAIRKILWPIFTKNQTAANENRKKLSDSEKKQLELDFYNMLTLFTGDMKIFSINPENEMRLRKIGSRFMEINPMILPSLPFDLNLADSLDSVSQNAKSVNDAKGILNLSLCIRHRLIATPNIQIPFIQSFDCFDFRKLSLINWKNSSNMVRLGRLLSSSSTTQINFKQKSILLCLLRVILDDPTTNQRHFQELLQFSSDRKTLGISRRNFFFSLIISSSEKQEQFKGYVETLEKLVKKLSKSNSTSLIFLREQHKFLSSFL